VGFVGPDGYPAGQQGYGYMPAGLQQQQPPQHTPYRQQPTGARLQVMRCMQLKAPESKRALLDFGLGVGVDLDRQVGQGCDLGCWLAASCNVAPHCRWADRPGTALPRPWLAASVVAAVPQTNNSMSQLETGPANEPPRPLAAPASLPSCRSCMVLLASSLQTC
jgi:hypothetical protein